MTWEIIAFSLLGWSLGLLMGLSLGFRVGTKRTILIFKRHFPTSQMMADVVKAILEKKP